MPAICSMRRVCARSRAGCCRRFPALRCVKFAESEICCGSAGIYNLLEPDAADAAARPQGAEHPQDGCGGDRVGQSWMPAADRHRPRSRGQAHAHHAPRRSHRSVDPESSGAIGATGAIGADAGAASSSRRSSRLAAWVFTISTANAMSSAMPMPGGWSMSMAWMSMGNQSPARARGDVSRHVGGR